MSKNHVVFSCTKGARNVFGSATAVLVAFVWMNGC